MTDHDAEMDTILQDDGDAAMRLTPEGEKVARQLALGADEDALLEALLGEA
jgi:hypothetical protein